MARPSTGNGLTISQLQQILNQRKSELGKLHKRRVRAQRELDHIDKQIARLEGRAVAGGRRGGGTRARNERSLVETLQEVMRQGKRPMRVGDLVEAVQRGGYRSNAANFRGLVNQTLIKEKKRFTQVDRGLYGLRGEGGAKRAKGKGDAQGQAA